MLGLHLEGPYINPVKGGAHTKEYIKRPEKEEIIELLEEADGVVKMMTLAPEVSDPDIIRLLRDYGVVVSAGHSNATFKEAVKGFDMGNSVYYSPVQRYVIVPSQRFRTSGCNF